MPPPNWVCTARQACALGCEGIVSKRLGSAYRSGRTDCWLEVKNPKCARGHARGRRGLELLSHGSERSMRPRRLPEPPFRRIASPLMQPSPIGRRVGIRIVTFEDLVITQAIPELGLAKAPADAPETIGDPVPQNIELHSLPSEVAAKVSQARSHSFFIKDGNNAIVLVSPNDRRVADVIH